MSQLVTQYIPLLEGMKEYPPLIFYKGNLTLLDRPKVSIVGTRKPQPIHGSSHIC